MRTWVGILGGLMAVVACGTPQQDAPSAKSSEASGSARSSSSGATASAPPSASATSSVTNTASATGESKVTVEPKFTVIEEEVEIADGDRKVHGTISRPDGPGKWPAVLFIAGSGPT